MITLNLYREDVIDSNGEAYPICNINVYDKINLILGDSGSGKTYLFNGLRLAIDNREPWNYTCYNHLNINIKLKVYAVSNIETLILLLKSEINSVLVIDEDTTQEIRKRSMVGDLRKSNNYFILMDRQMEIKLDVNVKAMFKLKERKYNKYKILDFKPFIELQKENIDDLNISKIRCMITEDTESGRIFWEKIFNKLDVVKFENYGNGSIKENIEKALNSREGDLLVAIDYDEGGVQMHQIYNSQNIDFNRLHFIPLESFEEVICNSDFILSKYPNLMPFVKDYKMYINPTHKSTGKYFSALLFNYVKVKPPFSAKSNKNVTKFYAKGADYFEECFIKNCCSYNRKECMMHYTGDKKKAMLANKFKEYRVFISDLKV